MKSIINFFKRSVFWRDIKIRTSLIIGSIVALGSLALFFINNVYSGLLASILLIVLVSISSFIFHILGNDSYEYVNELVSRIDDSEQEALIKMPIGILLYNDEYEVVWINPYLAHYIEDSDILGEPIASVSPLFQEIISGKKDISNVPYIKWGEYYFEVVNQPSQRAFYLLEVTRYANIENKAQSQRITFGQIAVNNYDEISESMDDLTMSNVDTLLTSSLNTWAKQYNIYIKKTSDDHYIFICFAKDIEEAKKNKFKILDLIRIQSSQLNAPLTLSIGIYASDENLDVLAKQAQNNLDLAQNRGGDQVVLKIGKAPIEYFGGKTDPLGKRTRVRARTTAFAIQELITHHKQIFVMGHARPDLDVMGAALGIRKIAAMNGVRCFIVIDPEKIHTDVQRLLKVSEQYSEIKKDIITPEQALKTSNDDDLLVLVDHSKSSMSISKELFDKLQNNVAVIDHHRRGEDFPEDPVLVYIEPYASSTCELIAELFEYQPTNLATISILDATAMLAGIVVDTQSFKFHTGTRTFDAASYLRSNGADEKLIHDLLKEKISSYLEMNALIETIDLRPDKIAICHGTDDKIYDPVVGAQAADTLVMLDGVSASFVITKRSDDIIGISARSMGDYNVQIIMEQMNGGGHLGNAATQIKNSTIAEVTKNLTEIIDKFDNNNKDS